MAQTIKWVCTKCGRVTWTATKPGATAGGKCAKSSAGTHTWVKGQADKM